MKLARELQNPSGSARLGTNGSIILHLRMPAREIPNFDPECGRAYGTAPIHDRDCLNPHPPDDALT